VGGGFAAYAPRMVNASPRHVTKAAYVYGELRERIAAGRFTPGEYLRLKPLAEDFDTSEVPVRDALRMLQRDGLAEMRRRGTSVVEIDWEEMREAIAVRTHLELLAIEEAVPHHDAGSTARMTDLLDQMDRHAAAGELEAFSRTARGFHAALYAPCPSELVKTSIEDLWVRLWHAGSRPLFQGLPDQLAEAQREHRAIVEAVRAGDAAAAVAAMREHRVTTLGAWKHVRAQRDPGGAGTRFQSKADRAYDELRRRIAAGRFAPGEPLRLDALARALRTHLELLELEDAVPRQPCALDRRADRAAGAGGPRRRPRVPHRAVRAGHDAAAEDDDRPDVGPRLARAARADADGPPRAPADRRGGPRRRHGGRRGRAGHPPRHDAGGRTRAVRHHMLRFAVVRSR
jgi:DNA-binding GntR family transcriptional regulator